MRGPKLKEELGPELEDLLRDWKSALERATWVESYTERLLLELLVRVERIESIIILDSDE